MKKIILPLLLLTVEFLPAQNSRWSLTTTPAVVQLPDIRYGIQLGATYRIKPHLDLLTELSTAVGNPADKNITNSHYLRVKTEFRHIFSSLRAPVKTYYGIQVAFADRAWTNTSGGSYFREKFYSDSSVNFSAATIRSPFLSMTAQLGGMTRITNHFAIDFFMGLGAKSVFTNYTNVKNPELVQRFQPKCKIMISPDPA